MLSELATLEPFSGCFVKAMLSIAEIAQLVERQTEDLRIPGSNPKNSHEF